MDDFKLIETLGQVSSREAGSIFRNFLRGGVRQMICEVMAAEVNDLCGPKHHPNESDCIRAVQVQALAAWLLMANARS